MGKKSILCRSFYALIDLNQANNLSVKAFRLTTWQTRLVSPFAVRYRLFLKIPPVAGSAMRTTG
jgi:hypothetical protein